MRVRWARCSPRLRRATREVDGSVAGSVSRTTGFPCALVSRMLAEGRWRRPGVAAPEHLGADEALTGVMLDGLAARNVKIRHRVGAPAELAG